MTKTFLYHAFNYAAEVTQVSQGADNLSKLSGIKNMQKAKSGAKIVV